MSPPVATPAVVPVGDLRVGGLLAEGGEGQVHTLPRQPHLVFKSYRTPGGRTHLEDLVTWPASLDDGGRAAVSGSSAWPCSVVTGEEGRAVGLLMPRAPRRFAVRHRDGHSRLASLSYLTADPAHRAAAYGLELPEPVTWPRVGTALALARLLAAFEAGSPAVGHGDLSTKNVLWSLQRGPEIFVIDCDSCDLFEPEGTPVERGGRRRAMTPNWDDPAVPRGHNPLSTTDRYSLALIFLRVAGAANFPIQARQRGGDGVEVRFPVPAGPASAALMDPDAEVWQLCARALSLAAPERRPPASAWFGPLARLVAALGGPAGPEEGAYVRSPAEAPPGDIRIVPERAPRRDPSFARPALAPRYGGAALPTATPIGYRSAVPTVAAPAAAPRMWTELKPQLARFLRWWRAVHRAAARAVTAPGRRSGRVRAVALCAWVDLAIAVLASAAVALVVSPLIGR
ncbi:MAG TPA: hypothetical protein VKI19_06400 [Acidimicrobiales bacterium]|nr:hypothetical protein [Acidimicrobiales bacterium]